ncbi:MAG: thiamine pyrophosphate-dependent dehydrogenase E1 component subunit alpha [bacterium]|nr:thiamine pyrophosphate-dependent dehydrogenase E1 component subunit alpha [bacterium]
MSSFVPTIKDIEIIRRLFYHTARIRMAEEKMAAIYSEKEIRCPMHLCTGQEAVPAGACMALNTFDNVMGTHRAHGHYLAKGGDLKKMFAEIYGKETGCCAGIGGSQHLIDLSINFIGSTPIVGGTIPIATGLAWAAKLRGEPSVTAVFFGDGATEEGVLHESMNFAVLHQLPIIYICENNLYSVYTPLNERQSKRKIVDIASAHGLQTLEGNGNDAYEVYSKTTTAVTQIRSGKGPHFLEFSTYRWREHCGPNFDNNIGYRSEEEFKNWKKNDPLEKIEQYALNNCFINDSELKNTKTAIAQEIEAALIYAKQSAFPNKPLTPENCYG